MLEKYSNIFVIKGDVQCQIDWILTKEVTLVANFLRYIASLGMKTMSTINGTFLALKTSVIGLSESVVKK